MTEDEAAQRWCPVGKSRTRFPDITPHESCIGKRCMAWQLLFENQGAYGSHVEVGGYCGLVGAPAS